MVQNVVLGQSDGQLLRRRYRRWMHRLLRWWLFRKSPSFRRRRLLGGICGLLATSLCHPSSGRLLSIHGIQSSLGPAQFGS